MLNNGFPSDEEVISVSPLVVKTPSGQHGIVLGNKKKEEEAKVSSLPLATMRSGRVYRGRVASACGVVGN